MAPFLAALDSMNWFRGFFRLWAAMSLLWMVLWGGVAVNVYWEYDSFQRRMAAACGRS
jgi:hypothetical protein